MMQMAKVSYRLFANNPPLCLNTSEMFQGLKDMPETKEPWDLQ